MGQPKVIEGFLPDERMSKHENDDLFHEKIYNLKYMFGNGTPFWNWIKLKEVRIIPITV